MVRVLVSSARFTSMLSNRHMAAMHVLDGLSSDIDVHKLTVEDQVLEFEQLVALAKRFARPWPYLLIDAPEEPSKRPRDNRTLANQKRALSPDLLDQIALAEAMLDAASELFPDVTFRTPSATITIDTPVSRAGSAIRDMLGVTWHEQLSTKDDYATLRLWSLALQEQGVYVSMRRLDDPTVRAFSIVSDAQAVVVADTQDIPYARTFSLLHEYTHIVLRSTGVCDLDEHVSIERYCNAVAAAVLMPGDLMTRVLPDRVWGTSLEEDDKSVAALANQLGVSKASLLIRLRDSGVLTQVVYDKIEAQRSERRGREKTKGGRYYPAAINKVGHRFARGVVGAYEGKIIDRQDASTLLEIPEHNLGPFRAVLAKSGGPR